MKQTQVLPMKKFYPLIGFLAICFGVQTISALITLPAIGEWYVTIEKPVWTPPDWVFGPVWMLLYTLMGISAWLVWKKKSETVVWIPLVSFFIQLILNGLWSYLFFGLQSPHLAMIEICVLWAAILITLITFSKVDFWAGVLLVPYLLWVTYALALNGAIVRLNPVV